MKSKIMIGAAMSLVSSISLASDITAGKNVAVVCAACHSSGGQPGVSNSELFPNLAGQKKAYLEKQLKAFKSGERKDVTMKSMAAGLSDADIANVASYFSSLK